MKIKQKKIMIIGGGTRQLQLIKAAKNENYYLVLCDCTSSCPGAKYADKFYEVDIIDRESLINVAMSEKIDGVISNSELAMLNVAAISQKMRKVGNSVRAIESLMSKNLFRQLQNNCEIFAPKHYEVSNIDEIINCISDMKFPIIIKPSESSGTRGTTIVENSNCIDDISKAFQLCKDFSRNSYVTIEEYVKMPSLDVIESDVFVFEDDIIWDGIFLTRRSLSLPMVPMTYSLPSGLDDQELTSFKAIVTKLIERANIRHGEFNVEAYFTPQNELFIIEINARQGGNQIPELVKAHCGIDMNKLLVTTTVNEDYYFNEVRNMNRNNNYVVKHAVFPRKDGIYKGLYIDDRLKKNVTFISDISKINDRIHVMGNASDQVCIVDLLFNDVQSQKNAIDNIEQLIYPIIE